MVADPLVALGAAGGVVHGGGAGLVAVVLVVGGGLGVCGVVADRARARVVHERAAERLAVAAAERARLAREMHDSLSKTLDAIALGAAALPATLDEPDRASRLARTLRDSTLDAARDARNLIADLRANAVDAPLRDLVHAITQDWSATSGVSAAVRCVPVDLPPPVIVELCGILREALRNVAAHAGAATVTVDVTHDRGEITLVVADDGTGFDPARPRGHTPARGQHGLVGMAERAKVCGGRLTVDAAPGRGTRVTAVVPASGEAPAGARRPHLVVVGAGVLACAAIVVAARPLVDPVPTAAPVAAVSTPARPTASPSGVRPSAAPPPAPSRPATRTAGPGPTGTPPPARTASPSTAAGAEPVAGRSGCHVRYSKRNEWNPGFIVDVTVENTGTTTVDGWTLEFAFTAGQALLSAWSATVTQAGTDVTANDGGINPTIAPGASVTFGIQGTWHGSDPVPPSFTLNGTRCT